MNDQNTNANFFFLRGKDGFLKGNYQNCIKDLMYAQEMYTTTGNKEKSAESSLLLASAYFNITRLDQSRLMFARAYSRFKELNKLVKLGECALALGEIYKEEGEFKRSRQYLFESIHIFTNLKDSEKIADSWKQLAEAYQMDLSDSIDHQVNIVEAYKTALDYYKKAKNNKMKAECEFDLGHVLISQSDHSKALKFLSPAFTYFKETNNHDNVITIAILIGRIYFELKKKPKAKEYMFEAISEMKRANYNPEKITSVQNTIISMFAG